MTVKSTSLFCLFEKNQISELLKEMLQDGSDVMKIFHEPDEFSITKSGNYVIRKEFSHLDNADYYISTLMGYLKNYLTPSNYRIITVSNEGMNTMKGYLTDPDFRFNILISVDPMAELQSIKHRSYTAESRKPVTIPRSSPMYTIITDEDPKKGLYVEYDPIAKGKLTTCLFTNGVPLLENSMEIGISAAKDLRKVLKTYIKIQEKIEKDYQ